MQTFGLSSSNSPSTRNAADKSLSENPAHAAERFGEVMHRAISGAASKPNQQKASPFADKIARENKSASNDIAAKKRDRAKRNSEHTSTQSQFLGISGASMATPQPVNQSAGNAHDSNGANGSTTPVSADAANTEAADADSTDLETMDPSTEPAPANTESNASETQISADTAEHPSTAAALAIQELAAQAIQAKSDPADPAEAESNQDAVQIGELKATGDPTSTPLTDPHGTSAAKQDMTMKKADKTQKVAGQTEQDLPGITATGGEDLPKGQKLSSKDALHGEKLETPAIELPVRVLNDSAAPTVTAAEAAPSPSIDARILERTHDMVALHAMRINESPSEPLHVMVKPGAGIQLSLELRQSARGIEVSASLHKGDFDQLKQYWPELQERLEARGVRVGTLTTAENFTNGGNEQFQQSKQQSPNQDPLYAGAFAEFALAGSMTEEPAARAARATAYRGWETWA